MRSKRVLAAAAATLTVLTLGLTACGGSSSGGDASGDASGGGDSAKTALVDELMAQLEGDGTITADQKNCLRDQFNGFTLEELQTIKNSTTDTDVPQALQDKVINAVMGCVMPSDAASPAAS